MLQVFRMKRNIFVIFSKRGMCKWSIHFQVIVLVRQRIEYFRLIQLIIEYI